MKTFFKSFFLVNVNKSTFTLTKDIFKGKLSRKNSPPSKCSFGLKVFNDDYFIFV